MLDALVIGGHPVPHRVHACQRDVVGPDAAQGGQDLHSVAIPAVVGVFFELGVTHLMPGILMGEAPCSHAPGL